MLLGLAHQWAVRAFALVPIDHFAEPTLWSMDWHGTCVQLRSLGFQHLDLEVTVPRVGIFRDAIVDLFDMATCLMSQKGARSSKSHEMPVCFIEPPSRTVNLTRWNAMRGSTGVAKFARRLTGHQMHGEVW